MDADCAALATTNDQVEGGDEEKMPEEKEAVGRTKSVTNGQSSSGERSVLASLLV